MMFWWWKPRLDDENVEPKSLDGRYQKFMEDNSKLNHAIDITEIISELKELRIIVDNMKNHDYEYDIKKRLSSKENWEENLEGNFQLEKT